MSKWIIVKREDRSATTEAARIFARRWLVGKEGGVRGICECWSEQEANMIADCLTKADM